MLYRISVTERGLTGIANIFRSRLSRLDDLLGAGTVPLIKSENYICISAVRCVLLGVSHGRLLTDLRGADQQQRAHVVEQLAGDVADEGGRLEPLLLRLPGRLEIARHLQKKLVQPAEWEEGGAVRQRSPTPAAMWRYNRAAASNMQVQRKVCSMG